MLTVIPIIFFLDRRMSRKVGSTIETNPNRTDHTHGFCSLVPVAAARTAIIKDSIFAVKTVEAARAGIRTFTTRTRLRDTIFNWVIIIWIITHNCTCFFTLMIMIRVMRFETRTPVKSCNPKTTTKIRDFFGRCFGRCHRWNFGRFVLSSRKRRRRYGQECQENSGGELHGFVLFLFFVSLLYLLIYFALVALLLLTLLVVLFWLLFYFVRWRCTFFNSYFMYDRSKSCAMECGFQVLVYRTSCFRFDLYCSSRKKCEFER